MLNNIHKKIFWSDTLLQALDLNQQSYSYSSIQEALKKKYCNKNSNYVIINDTYMKELLKLTKNYSKFRISYLMNHFIKYFIISNDRPTTKYYSVDCDFNKLDNKSITDIISIL
jgi:hypothetical protein